QGLQLGYRTFQLGERDVGTGVVSRDLGRRRRGRGVAEGGGRSGGCGGGTGHGRRYAIRNGRSGSKGQFARGKLSSRKGSLAAWGASTVGRQGAVNHVA